MSGDVFTQGKGDGGFKGIERTNLVIGRKDFCKWIYGCDVKHNLVNLCVHCHHRKKFDIPKMLKEYKEKMNGNYSI